MTITAVQARLILDSFMSGIRNELAFADLVSWEMHSAEMNDRNGRVVSEQVGPEYTITETNGAVANLSGGVQSTVFGAQTFTLNKVFGLSFGASDIESIKSFGAAKKSRALRNGISRLATRLDAHIGDTIAKAFPWCVGTPGTVITDPDQVASARTRLAETSIESDAGLSSAMTHADFQKLSKYIYAQNASLSSEGPRAMRAGFSGMLMGIPQRATNQLGRITTGTRTNGTVAGAGQSVNYVAASDSGSNAGYYLTQTINLAGLGAAGTVNPGEIFSITTGTPVNSYDADVGRDRGFAQQFTVLDGGTADGTGALTVRIFPAIVVGDGTSTTGTAGVNNAHRTVTAAPANGAVVTWLGTASTTYTPRVMFKKDAIVVHSAPLVKPYTGMGFDRPLADASRDNVAPLVPRLWMFSDPNTGDHMARIDVVVQAQVRDRWGGITFYGV